VRLVTVQEMKQLETDADAAGHSFAAMMEQAGQAVSDKIQARIDVKGKRILILVGPGNNGGDGLVAARYLSQAGAQIICYPWKTRPEQDPNLQAVHDQGIHCVQAGSDPGHKTLTKALQNADVIVDALLGTGIKRPIKGDLEELLNLTREIVERRRQSASPRNPDPISLGLGRDTAWPVPSIVAVDVPSGLDCDTGAVDPATLNADLTVTFGAPKHGQFRFPGAAALGELVVADIGLDPALSADITAQVLTPQKVCDRLPGRPIDTHKGTFGKAMIVAGSINYTGAPYLAATAAARVGTGLVTLAPPQVIHPIVASKLCEATFLILPHRMGVLVADAVRVLASHLEGYTALLLGPGLGQEKETVSFVHQLLGLEGPSQVRQIGFQRNSAPKKSLDLPPLVLDADALNALAGVPDWWHQIPANCILTPHPGEMARLTKKTTAEINADRLSIAREYAAQWNQVVVLKGAFTVIATPDQHTTLVPFANPGLATAGTGDVLAGCIAGMLAQGLSPANAACCGAYVHALAGHMVAEQTGTTGMLAGDLLPHLPLAIRRIYKSQGHRQNTETTVY